ncbi:heavy metal translocatin [Lentinus tigrinus ALCF2SS1-7]|uniref:Heavy metal translocatin n=1 Tax=Lentinus tigrinus ALCF2SS1-6 TaxID=1328759 RepID=A0A5C2SLK6_9APHY|nr:heavy metal translocatin [Lentinus tigrinus ALCF2SS1-6]RPD76701.1 heavy metal translocatin [Lentinus tigrinus ALCF2SS1-7]
MGGCCGECASDVDAQSVRSTASAAPSAAGEPGCCVGSTCECDDGCFDELARVICADDETHLHDQREAVCGSSKAGSCHEKSTHDEVTSDCTCYASDTKDMQKATNSRPSTPASACEQGGLRKRPTTKTSPAPPTYRKEACGEHRTIARGRYNDTLAAFGCVCRALLARGLKSCCTANGKAVAGPGSSKQSTRLVFKGRASHESSRPASVHSCCGKSDCGGGPALSIRSIPYRGHADVGSRSAKSRSCASVDSCCREDCCGGGSCGDGTSIEEKSEHVALDIVEKPVVDGSMEHTVLAVKGMTCTGCENKLIRTLRGISAIRNVKTSLVLCRAEFDFDKDATDVASLVQLIEKRSGFSAEVIKAGSTRDLLLTVPRALQDKMLNMPRPLGVEAFARTDKDNLRVTYDPNVVGPRQVFEFYESYSPVLAPEPPDPAIMAGAKHIRSLAVRAALSATLTIPVLVMTWAPLPPHPRAYSIASLVLATIVQVGITGPFYLSSLKSLMFSRLVETELLIVLSTTAAYVYSVVAFTFDMLDRPLATGEFFETSTLLVTLIMVGQVVSAVARQRAIEAISIRSLQERTACIVLPDSTESVVDVRLLHYEDTFKVLPDSAIITDGEVTSGTSTVDESMMTGESRPVEKGPGSAVIAGTLNGPSTLFVKVKRLPGENTISDIARMVDDARFSRARVQEAVDWICGWFVPVVLVLALITFAVWMAVGVAVRHQSKGEAAVTALTYAISVLAISCPCAIGLAVPMVILIAGGVGAKLGLVFKAATTIEQARKVNHVVLDKTGTVTEGKLAVVSRFVDDATEFDVQAVVAEFIATSRHPVSRAVAANLAGTAATQGSVEKIEMVTGKGVQGTLLGQDIRGGSAGWLGLEAHPAVQPFIAQGLTTFCVVHGDRLLAAFGLSDTLRPEAVEVIRKLTARNIRVSILSGDHPNAVFSTAAELGIPAERVRASCLPADKQAYIKELTAQGDTVLFCGDGTNDAVALAQAAIGVHLHTGDGAGVAASTAADVVLTHPSLTGILTLLELSEAVARRIALNFGWSFVYNLVAILLAAGAFVHVRVAPAYAGLGEIVSVLPVVVVALQLKWFKSSL